MASASRSVELLWDDENVTDIECLEHFCWRRRGSVWLAAFILYDVKVFKSVCKEDTQYFFLETCLRFIHVYAHG